MSQGRFQSVPGRANGLIFFHPLPSRRGCSIMLPLPLDPATFEKVDETFM